MCPVSGASFGSESVTGSQCLSVCVLSVVVEEDFEPARTGGDELA